MNEELERIKVLLREALPNVQAYSSCWEFDTYAKDAVDPEKLFSELATLVGLEVEGECPVVTKE